MLIQAKLDLVNDPESNHEYLPIAGYAPFLQASGELLFGKDAAVVREKRLVTNQMVSGSGANHIAAEFLANFYKFPTAKKEIYVSNPSWPNHYAIMHAGGLETVDYTYYNPKTFALDYDGMKAALKAAPDGSVVLLHTCAHNPTGVDPNEEQWKDLAELFKEKKLFAFFDCAYQGFASGDPDRDAFSVRYFESQKTIPMLVCQSFAKNAGLYGERIGALHMCVSEAEEVPKVQSQLNTLQRSEISSCPSFGAYVVARMLTSEKLLAEWHKDIQTMAHRIIEMRTQLHDLLVNKYQTPGTWNHIVDQTGMFSFLGLDKQQVERLVKEGHIYLLASSRISMAGLNPSNIDHVARWIDKVVREAK